MASPEDDESDEDKAGMEALMQTLEPYTERGRKSKYGVLHISGGRFAVIVRSHCGYTQARGRQLATAHFEFMKGYEEVDFPTAIKHILKLRAEEEDSL